MAQKWHYLALAVIILLPIGFALVGEDAASSPNSVQLICDIDSVTTTLHNNDIAIPILMTNITDSVGGFDLRVNTDPRYIRWVIQTAYWDTFTTCVGYNQAHQCTLSYKDSLYVRIPKFDTVGTRCRGFEVFSARIVDAIGAGVKIIAKADNGAPPIKKPIGPGSGTLLKLYARTVDSLGDSLCVDSTRVVVRPGFDKEATSFSNQLGETIGCNYELVVDTFYFNCLVWDGSTCVGWRDTVLDSFMHCVIDTTKRVLLDGAIGFDCRNCSHCGDADANGVLNITDVVYLINFVFNGVPIPVDCNYTYGMGDANGDRIANITDAVSMISFIFNGTPCPHCQGMPCWVQ